MIPKYIHDYVIRKIQASTGMDRLWRRDLTEIQREVAPSSETEGPIRVEGEVSSALDLRVSMGGGNNLALGDLSTCLLPNIKKT